VVGDRAVIGIGNGIAELQATPANSLADDAQFQQVMATLPGEFSQVAYVDLSRVMGLAMMMTGNMGFERDADLACADYADQAAAQAALEASPVANANLDRNSNGQACEDAFATPGATPVASQGSLQNIRALGAVTFEQDGKARMSGILYIAGSGA
jgi:type IV secretory pathway VirB2 component (pilin)